MSTIPAHQLSNAEKEQLAVSYAAFVLSAQDAEVTPDSINAVLAAANIKASQSLVKAFSKILASRKVTDFCGAIGGGSATTSAPTTTTSAPKNDGGKKGAESKKEAPPPPPPAAEEEEDMDMGGLFD